MLCKGKKKPEAYMTGKKHHFRYWVLFPALLAAVLLAACGGAPEADTLTPSPFALPTAEPTPAPPARVTLGSKSFDTDSETLSLPVKLDVGELKEKLALFPRLRYVAFYGGGMDRAAQDELTETFPGVTFRWDSLLLGRVVPYNTRSLSFAGEALEASAAEEICRAAAYLPSLESVDLTGCGLEEDDLLALDEALGDTDVIRGISVYGKEFGSADEEIDLSGVKIRDNAQELETLLPHFPHLKKVVMSGCGIPDEEMDALNKKYEDIRFVWSVYFSIWSLRTDATNFICARTVNHAPLFSWQCEVLRYCTDLIALDLGHKNISDLSFLYHLPKLQYLILVETDIRDLTPIGSLSELKYLEIFWTKVYDLSPLINCTKLQDLNICYIYARADDAFSVLMQMPWLERLWYCGNGLKPAQVEALKENMPECEMYLAPHGESTGSTWRTHPHYYEMRDVFEMYYMPGGTNGVAADGSQIVNEG